ncbi:MAG TPA: NAD-binding protein, partial [bacterium]|nr:NAD-binding protein [bacterium]
EDVKDLVSVAASLDTTEEKALRSLGIENVDVAVVCIGDVEANLLTTLLLKKMGLGQVFSRAVSPLQKEILKTLGVNRIIEVEEEMGEALASTLIAPRVLKHVVISDDYSMVEIKVPDFFVGKKLKDLELRKKYRVNVVALKKTVPVIDDQGRKETKEEIDPVPEPEWVFSSDDIIIVAGHTENLEKLTE